MVHGTRRIPSDLVSALLAGWERASSMPVLLLDPTRGISVSIRRQLGPLRVLHAALLDRSVTTRSFPT